MVDLFTFYFLLISIFVKSGRVIPGLIEDRVFHVKSMSEFTEALEKHEMVINNLVFY
jgi:hypothetical protein